MTKYYREVGTLLIRNSDIKDNRFEFTENPIHLEEGFAEENTTRRLYIGDVITVHTGDIGTSAVITENEDGAIGFATINTRPNPKIVDSNYLSTFFNTNRHKNFAIKMSTGDGRSNYNLRDFNKVIVPLPSLMEQKEIGTFFCNLDHLITLHQRKYDALLQLKKAYLQNLFPSNGELVPKLRFANFTENWEWSKLGKVAKIVSGGTPSTSVKAYWDGDINWFTPAEVGRKIYMNSSKRKITELGLQKSSAKILPKGTVLFTSRAGIGNTAILSKESSTNQGFQSIVPYKDKLDNYFIFSRTNELKRYGETNGAGSTFVEVSGKQMQKMPLLIPCLKEQLHIGNIFKQIDSRIVLHHQKIENLKILKKAYLQKLFV